MQTDTMLEREASVDRAAHQPRLWVTVVLWVLAVVLMLSSAVYQRMTGPTHPLRGTADFGGGKRIHYKLIRSEEVVRDARVSMPAPSDQASGQLYWRRYKTGEDFTAEPLKHENGELSAMLPAQLAAGKLEYYLKVSDGGSQVRVPDDRNVVMRFKGVVPLPVLLVHIFLMFFAMLWGMRTMLESLFDRHGIRWMARTTFILMTAGGMVMGPLVQLYAFGVLWSGVPFGWDLTDNKVLVMWVCWLVAVLAIGWRSRPITRAARWITVVAALLMIVVYLIPHSKYGSELNYEQVEEGVNPVEAIGQG
jgi:hypothetical protein